MPDRIRPYLHLTRLHRPIGILLLLWPMLWALWLAAGGWPDMRVLLIFLAGTVLMRSAGCAMNDYADRDFDGEVRRTSDRPLVTGALKPRDALLTAGVLTAIAATLVLFTNVLTIGLAVGGALLAATYPFAKRYTYLPQLHLGAAFGWAVPMAFAAQVNALPPLAWLTFCAAVLWAVIYDTEYAMVDRDDDLRIGVKSTAILFDDNDRLIIGVLQVLLIVNLAMIGSQADLRWPWYAGLAVAAVLFIYQQYLIRGRDGDGCFAAFLNNNWVGFVVFAGLVANFALSR